MPDQHQLSILREGVEAWNLYRRKNPKSKINFANANLRGANLRGADLGSAFRGEFAFYSDLSGADLQKAELSCASLKNAKLVRANLRGANLNRANLSGANLIGADLSSSDLSMADFRHVYLANSDGKQRADLSGANLNGALLTRPAELTGRPGSLLDLALARGLGTAHFGDPEFLASYLSEAFELTHADVELMKQRNPTIFSLALRRVRLLCRLYQADDPSPQLIEVVQAITSSLVKHLAKHPKELFDLRPRQFEELIGEILASYGWEVNLTPATRDGGYDLFAFSKDAAGVRTSWIIECKKYRHDRKVGIDIARNLYGVRDLVMPAGMMMLATTSHFSREVNALKASRYDLTLRDYEGVLEWLNEYKPNSSGRLYIRENRLVAPDKGI
ncbi:MAG: hypothetical protein GY719_25425 [bacterium]|nr:hypothetical protein [bacterium]